MHNATKPNRRRFRLPPYLLSGVLMAAALPWLSRTVLAQAGADAPADTAAAGAEGDTEQRVIQTPERSLLDWYWAGGDFMHPIALCSFLGLALVIERFVSLRRGVVAPAGLLPGLKGAMRDPRQERDRQAGIDYCTRENSPAARMVAAGIKKVPRGVEAVEKSLEDAGALEASGLRRNMRFLYSLASVATLLGLIGTIQGMIQAFQTVEAVGSGQAKALAGGIYTALITTFAGLAVAIPITVFYFFFAGRIDRLIGALNEVAGEFVDHYSPAIPSAAAVVPASSNGAPAGAAHAASAAAPAAAVAPPTVRPPALAPEEELVVEARSF